MWYNNQTMRDKCNILSILRQYLGKDYTIKYKYKTNAFGTVCKNKRNILDRNREKENLNTDIQIIYWY